MIYPALLFMIAVLFTSAEIQSATTANATVTFTISSINEISVSGNPGAMTINTATAGSEPTNATEATTTWNVTTNSTAQKVTGSIDTNMPANTTLSANLDAPSGATSSGSVSLSTTSADLVTGISNVAEGSLGITYTITATVAATPVGPINRTVTFTLGP